MKKMMCITAIITAFMLLMPLAVLGQAEPTERESLETLAPIKEDKKEKDVFRVFNKESGEITEMAAEDYIFGVVAAEMPALYEVEALKAQAVAAYTYACYKRQSNEKADYDITTDFSTDQSFKTSEKANEDWGENAEEYTEKIKSAVESVIGECIMYEKRPILAVYHAVSCGQTYSAKDVWGKDIEYLKSVPSKGDKLASNYTAVVEFTETELEKKLESLVDNKKEDTALLGKLEAKNNGLVENVKLYGKAVEGSKIRTALNLPSTNFKFERQDGKYIFTCLGYGHGVGMSQKGADYMAKQGYTYKQILSHYYENTTVSNLFTNS